MSRPRKTLHGFRHTWGETGYEVTDSSLADHLIAKGFRMCGVTAISQPSRWVDCRHRQSYLVFHFVDSQELRWVIKDYQDSWEGYEWVIRPKTKGET